MLFSSKLKTVKMFEDLYKSQKWNSQAYCASHGGGGVLLKKIKIYNAFTWNSLSLWKSRTCMSLLPSPASHFFSLEDFWWKHISVEYHYKFSIYSQRGESYSLHCWAFASQTTHPEAQQWQCLGPTPSLELLPAPAAAEPGALPRVCYHVAEPRASPSICHHCGRAWSTSWHPPLSRSQHLLPQQDSEQLPASTIATGPRATPEWPVVAPRLRQSQVWKKMLHYFWGDLTFLFCFLKSQIFLQSWGVLQVQRKLCPLAYLQMGPQVIAS